jgi:two-component system, sensor histidine kinase and response regulator
MNPKDHLVVFVDDDRASRVVFEQAFGKMFRVKCVESGPKALAVLKEEPVAVLVTDQRMPEMSGDELLEQVKVISPDTVRIVATAYSDLDPILRAVNEGLVVRYIIKPWDRTELQETLRWALEVFAIGRANSAVQLRVIQTERVLTLGQATAAVIHDLRQPLLSIALNVAELAEFAELAPTFARLSGGETYLDAKERSRLARMAEDLPGLAADLDLSVKFMNDVLKQLSLLRERGISPAEPAEADPVTLVRLAIAMCRQEAVEFRCCVLNEVPESLPRVRATSAQVLQILINVIRNAQQAVGRTGARGNVLIQAAAREDTVHFAVCDDGPGMSAEVLSKLGRPFFTTREDGTGLGVAQVQRLLGLVGGTIEITSVENRGTTVKFVLPQVPCAR